MGAAAAAAALYGYYRVLPAWLTGPEVCLMEDGGCAVLFRSPRARLIGVPNALLGVLLYALLATGLLLHWPAWLLFAMMLPAVAMSAVLGYSLITAISVPHLLTGHVANAVTRWRCSADADVARRAMASWRRRRSGPDPQRRENIAQAQRAEQIWADRLAKDARDFESAWKLARARYWLGTHAPEKSRKAALESGITAGRAAIAAASNKPEGHFWVAANMGALAESFGMGQGLKYRGDIKNELETVLRLDPAFQQGSADRALGRWYFKVPGLFGGSDKKAEEHLRKSLTYNPNSASSLFFLAETLIDLKRKPEAKAILEKLIANPVDPEWAAEDRDFKAKASVLIKTLS